MRKRGAVEWRSAAEAAELAGGELTPDSPIADFAIAVKHLGVVEAQRAMRKLRRLRLDELRRLKREQAELLAAGCEPSDAPELFPAELADGDVRTPEGEAQLAEVCREVVGAVLAGHKGLDLPEDAPTDDVLDELARLGLLELFMPAAMEVQAPEPQFPAADAGAGGGE